MQDLGREETDANRRSNRMARAAELGVERIYLFTPDQMLFYARLGWSALEVVEYRGETVTIMECRIG